MLLCSVLDRHQDYGSICSNIGSDTLTHDSTRVPTQLTRYYNTSLLLLANTTTDYPTRLNDRQ